MTRLKAGTKHWVIYEIVDNKLTQGKDFNEVLRTKANKDENYWDNEFIKARFSVLPEGDYTVMEVWVVEFDKA